MQGPPRGYSKDLNDPLPNLRGETALLGFEFLESAKGAVGVMRSSRNGSTTFTFDCTFTSADLGARKVSFTAVATIVDHRDAARAAKELISSAPTVVSKSGDQAGA